jgi:ribosomal protein L37E
MTAASSRSALVGRLANGLAYLALFALVVVWTGSGGGIGIRQLWPLAVLSGLGLFIGFRQRMRQAASKRSPTTRCRRCGYDLTASRLPRCPECGTLLGFKRTAKELGIDGETEWRKGLRD